VAGFIADLKSEDVGIVLVGNPGIQIDVTDELGEVALLERPGFPVFQAALLPVLAGETRQRRAALRVACIANCRGVNTILIPRSSSFANR